MNYVVEELSIFDFMYETFKFSKNKITLIELFSGIGSQATALEKLAQEYGVELDVLGVSEIDKYAIQSYNAIFGETHNFGNIMDIKELPYTDILTYSFPCQDISLAGKGKGFTKGSGSRSGLLWEVERILDRQKEIDKLPQVLLMENVKALASVKFVDDFNKWKYKLQELGYSNYWEILNAKDYGIPQNRERVFMVSILGEWNYTFPKPFPLELRLKDMLENEVNDKYYLSDKMIKFFKNNSEEQKAKGNGFRFDPSDGTKEAKAITTRAGARMDDNFIKEGMVIGNTQKNCHRGTIDEPSPTLTITTMSGGGHEPKILIPEATKKGYAEAHEGDGCYINRPHQKRGVVQKDMIQTIKTSIDDIGVVVNPLKGQTEYGWHFEQQIYDEKGIAPTVMENHGTVTATTQNLKIRKLTPKECWRLMGFSDEQFEKAEQVCSNSQLYKQAGNSIVVDVLYYIFKQLFEEEQND